MSGSTTMTPGNSVGAKRTSQLLFENPEEVAAVAARLHRVRDPRQLAGGDVAHPVGDLLEARDHQSLTFFHRLDVIRRLHQRLVRSRVEPGNPARQLLDVKLSAIE